MKLPFQTANSQECKLGANFGGCYLEQLMWTSMWVVAFFPAGYLRAKSTSSTTGVQTASFSLNTIVLPGNSIGQAVIKLRLRNGHVNVSQWEECQKIVVMFCLSVVTWFGLV